MEAIIYALVAFFGWGTGDVFGGLVARKINGYSSTFWLYVFSLIISSFYAPFAVNELHSLTFNTGLLLLVLVPIGIIPLITFYEGIRVGSASLVGTIGASFAAFSVVLSIIFLGDRVNYNQTLSIIIIFSGLLLSSLDLKMLNLKQIFTDKGVPYGLISMILWGVYFTFVRIPVREIGWFWPAYFSWCAFPLIYFIIRIKRVGLEFPKGTKVLTSSLLNTLLLGGAAFAYNIAIAKGQTAIVAPIAGSYPVLFVVLAYFIFKDRLKGQQILGVIITLFGIVVLSVNSG